jgi:hypothetical protein
MYQYRFISFIFAFGLILTFINASPLRERDSSSSCSIIRLPAISGASIISVESVERRNYTVPATPPLLLKDVSNLDVCEVRVTLSHTGADDKVVVLVWLPLNNWNGRFTAVGGSGWAAGLGSLSLAPVASQGFAVASTDAGLSGDPSSPAAWALGKNSEVNNELLKNFASRSIHDLAIVGKSVTASYYGKHASYSYWNGCSTGGRQGLVAAQEYPEDFDGILAGAPAIYWPTYVIAEQWPQVVMKEANVYPSQCELQAFTKAAIEACDTLDGVSDNVISRLDACKFDPFSIVGSTVQCEGKQTTLTRAMASVVQKIWEGPKTDSGVPLWYGLTFGAPLDYLANTTVVNGTRTGLPFFINDGWIRYFVKANPSFDMSSIGYSELIQLFSESSTKYDHIIGSANPDLSGLQKSGGKLLVWHGDADQLIFPQGTIRYRQQVEKSIGGGSKADRFFRLFLAPGVDHCGLGSTEGAVPSDPFGSLISWVEQGEAPEYLLAAKTDAAGQVIMQQIQRYSTTGPHQL